MDKSASVVDAANFLEYQNELDKTHVICVVEQNEGKADSHSYYTVPKGVTRLRQMLKGEKIAIWNIGHCLRRLERELKTSPDSTPSVTTVGVTFYLLLKGIQLPAPLSPSLGLRPLSTESGVQPDFSNIPIDGRLPFNLRKSSRTGYFREAKVEYEKFERYAELYRQQKKTKGTVYMMYNKTQKPRMFHGKDELRSNLKLEGVIEGLSARIFQIEASIMTSLFSDSVVIFRSK